MAFGDLLGTLQVTAASITNPMAATGSVVVSVADLVYCNMSEQSGLTVTTVSDNLGNTYTPVNAGSLSGSSFGSARSYYSRVTVAGTLTSVSAVTTSGTHDASWGVCCFAGPFATSPLDANPANGIDDVATPYTAPATGTLAQASELVVASVSTQGTLRDWAATSPNLMRLSISASNNAVCYIASQVVAATTSVVPAFTGTAPTHDVLITASFKAAVSTFIAPKPVAILQAVNRGAFW